MAPHYSLPALPVAAHYADAGNAPQAGSNAASIGWREYFTDPELQRLILEALRSNRDLRIAVLHVEESRAAYGIQRAAWFPVINAQAGVDRSRVPADLNLTQKKLQGNEFKVELGMASWEIDFWGRIRSLQDAALATYLATDAAQHATEISLISQVADAYLNLRELDERIRLAGRSIDSRAETLRIFSRRVAVGSSSRFELTQVQTLLTQAQTLGAQLRQARAAALNALTLLTGASVNLPTTENFSDTYGMPVELRAGLPSDLLLQRPDIIAAEHQLAAANANIGAARAAFFPRVALTASFGTASAKFDGLFAADSQAWVFSPSISLPIFDGGSRRNNLSLTEARRDLAVASYEQTVQSAFRDVSDALSARHWLREQLEIAQSALATQQERVRLSRLRYDAGTSAFLEVLDAERDLLVAEQQLVQTQRLLLSSHVSLYAALGGGSMAFGPNNPSPTGEPAQGVRTP
jgi:multidrug efflux system outer membrane protein